MTGISGAYLLDLCFQEPPTDPRSDQAKEFPSSPQRFIGMYDDENLTGSIAWASVGRWGSGLLVTITSIGSVVQILSGTASKFL